MAVASTGCSALLGPDPTPVPGAAATLTRSINTPIPTPVRTPSALASPSPSPRLALPASPAPSASASASPPAAADQALNDADVSAAQARLQQVVSTPDLTGIESLLLDHVSMSTAQGGSVMDSQEAASWLRDHAGPGITVGQVDRSTQEVMVQMQTDGWPKKDPLQSGQVTFSFRRYDANGRQDETGGGEWKIDVIEAD